MVLGLVGGAFADKFADISHTTMQKQVCEFLATHIRVLRHVRDAMADSQDKQKNKLMQKAEDILTFMKFVTKSY